MSKKQCVQLLDLIFKGSISAPPHPPGLFSYSLLTGRNVNDDGGEPNSNLKYNKETALSMVDQEDRRNLSS